MVMMMMTIMCRECDFDGRFLADSMLSFMADSVMSMMADSVMLIMADSGDGVNYGAESDGLLVIC